MRKLKVRTLAELLDLTITYRILSELHQAIDQRQLLILSSKASR